MFEPVHQQMPLLAAPCRSLPDAPALETVDFLIDFNEKSILFQSRQLWVGWGPAVCLVIVGWLASRGPPDDSGLVTPGTAGTEKVSISY